MKEIKDLGTLSDEAKSKKDEADKDVFVKKMQDLSKEYGFDIFPYMEYTPNGCFPAIGINKTKDEVKQ